MAIKYSVVARDLRTGLLIKTLGTYDTIEEANLEMEYFDKGILPYRYLEIEVVYS